MLAASDDGTNALILALYFRPSIVAFIRKQHRAWRIFAVNLLLGWTVVGWIVAMVWATTRRSSLSPDQRDKNEMLNMRATMMSIHELIFQKDQKRDWLVRMKTGMHLEKQFAN